MALSRDEIFSRVKSVLIEALGVDDDEVSETAILTNDLGAESIDFLDIVFRLEKDFSIKIPKGELFQVDLLDNPEYVDGGNLTKIGLAKLKESMPHADLSSLDENPDVSRMADLFTVDTIVKYVELKLAA